MMLEMLRAESAMRGEEVTEDDLEVTLLADLQQQQALETHRLTHNLQDKVKLVSCFVLIYLSKY